MSIGKVTRNFQVTIPAGIRATLRIKVGSLVDFVVEKGSIIIKPKTLIDDDQAWFWTEEWQRGEKDVDKSAKKGAQTAFKNVSEIRKHFDR